MKRHIYHLTHDDKTMCGHYVNDLKATAKLTKDFYLTPITSLEYQEDLKQGWKIGSLCRVCEKSHQAKVSTLKQEDL